MDNSLTPWISPVLHNLILSLIAHLCFDCRIEALRYVLKSIMINDMEASFRNIRIDKIFFTFQCILIFNIKVCFGYFLFFFFPKVKLHYFFVMEELVYRIIKPTNLKIDRCLMEEIWDHVKCRIYPGQDLLEISRVPSQTNGDSR